MAENLKNKFMGVTAKASEYVRQGTAEFQKATASGTREIKRVASEVGADLKKTAENNKLNSPLPSDFASEVQKAANILASFTADPETVEGGLDNVIPVDVIQKARGLAMFTVVKAGFMWSGRMGSGMVIARLEDGSWSPPSCIAIGGVGFGVQVGADVTDFVIILNTDDAVKAFSHPENVTLGGNLSVTAGPVGIGGEVSGSLVDRAPLFAYSKSKGLFAGVSLEGTMIIGRKDANKQFYGHEVSAADVLAGKVEVPALSTNVLHEVIKRAETRKPGSAPAPTKEETDKKE
jgi:lipid-binding SYLF domain-containing protein